MPDRSTGVAIKPWSVAFAGLATVMLMAALAAYLKPQTAASHASDRYSGTVIEPRPAPEFHLATSAGDPAGIRDFHGSLVVLTFLDPRCRDTCPIIAYELRELHNRLGPRASDVVFLAVSTNAAASRPEDLQAFSAAFGLDKLSNWYFVTGSPEQLTAVWSAYGVASVPLTERVDHTSGVFLVDRSGMLRLYISVPLGTEDAPRLSDALLERMEPLL